MVSVLFLYVVVPPFHKPQQLLLLCALGAVFGVASLGVCF